MSKINECITRYSKVLRVAAETPENQPHPLIAEARKELAELRAMQSHSPLIIDLGVYSKGISDVHYRLCDTEVQMVDASGTWTRSATYGFRDDQGSRLRRWVALQLLRHFKVAIPESDRQRIEDENAALKRECENLEGQNRGLRDVLTRTNAEMAAIKERLATTRDRANESDAAYRKLVKKINDIATPELPF